MTRRGGKCLDLSDGREDWKGGKDWRTGGRK